MSTICGLLKNLPRSRKSIRMPLPPGGYEKGVFDVMAKAGVEAESVDGGRKGSPNYVEFIPKNGEWQRFAFASGLKTQKDDVIRVVTGSGGGFGDPTRRDPDLVRRDVKNGLISAEHAEEVYGITIEPDKGEDSMKANAPLMPTDFTDTLEVCAQEVPCGREQERQEENATGGDHHNSPHDRPPDPCQVEMDVRAGRERKPGEAVPAGPASPGSVCPMMAADAATRRS